MREGIEEINELLLQAPVIASRALSSKGVRAGEGRAIGESGSGAALRERVADEVKERKPAGAGGEVSSGVALSIRRRRQRGMGRKGGGEMWIPLAPLP